MVEQNKYMRRETDYKWPHLNQYRISPIKNAEKTNLPTRMDQLERELVTISCVSAFLSLLTSGIALTTNAIISNPVKTQGFYGVIFLVVALCSFLVANSLDKD